MMAEGFHLKPSKLGFRVDPTTQRHACQVAQVVQLVSGQTYQDDPDCRALLPRPNFATPR